MKRFLIPLLFLLAPLSLAAFTTNESIPLAGKWKFAIDAGDKGVGEKWFSRMLADEVVLPGSMAQNRKGDDITLKTKWTASIYDSSFFFNPRMAKFREPGNIKVPFFLQPVKYYVGAAWYQKDVQIPAGWKGRHVVLYLERVHSESRVWVDGREIGLRNSLVAAHEYDLSEALSPGKHRITLRIDNRIKEINVGVNSHSVSDHTQGNWNGVIGKMELQATPPVFIDDMQVYPDIHAKTARVSLLVRNTGTTAMSGSLNLLARTINTSVSRAVPAVTGSYTVAAGSIATVELTLPIGDGMQLWDEFTPALYQLNATITAGNSVSGRQTQFGMREFKIEGNRFLINGHPVFLRGTVNCCEFPLTGYPSTDVKEWERIFRVARAHGLNHMRFHSWCPPEAAFMAADRVGFYLMPEGPTWPNGGVSIGNGRPIDQYIYDETDRMARNYGNYASFTMLSAGNEPAGNQIPFLNAFVAYWKKKDTRRVYTGMSVGGSWPTVPDAEFQVRGGVRDINWERRPETTTDFSSGIAAFKVPFVTHEMGQYCVFPDFSEIKKYTGVYKARNMEIFQSDLEDRGMGSQAHDFLMASGALQVLSYKHTIEKALRTPGYGGFELLGLQDFPGQGTALVGVLNVFWQDKAYSSPEIFSRFCNSTVPLATIPKFIFTNDETFTAGVELFHSGAAPLNDAVIQWVIRDEKGKQVKSGAFASRTIENGNGILVGNIDFPLSGIDRAGKFKLEVSVKNTTFINDWDFWVYPVKPALPAADVYYTTSLDEKAKDVLEQGGKVFLNMAGKVVKGKEVIMHFLPVFWNTSWFKMRPPHVTGMYIQASSPAFSGFPTSTHSDLQWWEIANRAQVMLLEDFPVGYKPLVQPIDTWFLNRRLALVAEVKVGKGKLVFSSADLGPDVQGKPAAKQLYTSLIAYMNSDKFNPSTRVSFDLVKDIMLNPSKETQKTFTKDSPDELKPNSVTNQKKQ